MLTIPNILYASILEILYYAYLQKSSMFPLCAEHILATQRAIPETSIFPQIHVLKRMRGRWAGLCCMKFIYAIKHIFRDKIPILIALNQISSN